MGLDNNKNNGSSSLSILLVRFSALANPSSSGGDGGDGGGGGGGGSVGVNVTIPAIYLQAAASRGQTPWVEVIDDACCTNPRSAWDAMGQ